MLFFAQNFGRRGDGGGRVGSFSLPPQISAFSHCLICSASAVVISRSLAFFILCRLPPQMRFHWGSCSCSGCLWLHGTHLLPLLLPSLRLLRCRRIGFHNLDSLARPPTNRSCTSRRAAGSWSTSVVGRILGRCCSALSGSGAGHQN